MDTAVVFPGQGTQQPGMGIPWKDHPAWVVVERAEAALGESLAPLLLDTPAEGLSRTREAQLSVLLTSLVIWEAARDTVENPVAFAGHSLGQVSALIAAGVLAIEDGVLLAARRAELTQAAADAHPGRMAALLGATVETAEAACTAMPEACWLANDNAPGQVVIAGTPEGVEAGLAHAKELGVRKAVPLNVGGAFHTPLMHEASEGLTTVLAGIDLHTPVAAVVSNDDGKAYSECDGWRERSARHVSVPVRWRDAQLTLTELGAIRWLEVGHGTMLAGLAKRTVPDVNVVSLSSPESLAAFSEGREHDA
ncbi:MAG: ACP S-malonyltransferase [Acidimicrobiia bacterium]